MENWVLLRGLARHSGHWNVFPESLSTERQANVFLFDMPGFGTSGEVNCPKKINDVVNHLNEKAEACMDGEFYVLGMSLGGMVTMKWLERNSNIKKAVIINSSLPKINRSLDRMQRGACVDILKCFFQNNLEKREKLILKLSSNFHAESKEVLKSWCDASREYPIPRRHLLNQLGWSLQASLPAERQDDFLFLCSEKDKICHPKCSHQIAEKMGRPFYEHPEAGHDLCLDDPAWVLKHIAKFLS